MSSSSLIQSLQVKWNLFSAALVALSLLCPPLAICRESAPSSGAAQLSSVPTEIRLASTPWWPTSGLSDRKQYAGTAACAKCHAQKAASQIRTSMARAGMRAPDSELLTSHPDLKLQLAAYVYRLVTKESTAMLSVSNGMESTTKKLEWAMGDGSFGQSYIYREQGKYYECQLSFYTRINGLDTTTGHMEPGRLETAAGGVTTPKTIRLCFGCHSTASTTNDHFDPDHAIMGVTCEACHGPGSQHVALMNMEGENARGTIMNPASLSPADSVDFCGACHRTSADAVLAGLSKMGVVNVRLQPYRLEKSKCWGGQGDKGLTCVACHDPHVQIVRNAGFFDAKCLQCHRQKADARAVAGATAAACKVATSDCVNCHMPKLEVPGTHSVFTDHWIRIVQPGAAYPN